MPGAVLDDRSQWSSVFLCVFVAWELCYDITLRSYDNGTAVNDFCFFRLVLLHPLNQHLMFLAYQSQSGER